MGRGEEGKIDGRGEEWKRREQKMGMMDGNTRRRG